MPIRLMAALLYLKHAFNLSDETVAERWSKNVVGQYLSGREYCELRLPCDATQVGRFLKAIGEAGVGELLRATVDTAVLTKAVLPHEDEGEIRVEVSHHRHAFRREFAAIRTRHDQHRNTGQRGKRVAQNGLDRFRKSASRCAMVES